MSNFISLEIHMKKTLIIFLIFVFVSNIHGQVKPYLSDIISSFPNVRDIAIYKNEVYFTIQSYQEDFSAIVFVKKENGKWSAPAVVNFSGQFKDLEPFITADGNTLYFASDRPSNPNSSSPKDFDIWYVKRSSTDAPWSSPFNLGEPVNTKYNEFYPSLTLTKDLYYTSDRPDSKGADDIFMAQNKGEFQYNDPISLSDSINTGGYEFNAFIAPDASYIIYTGYNRKNGAGSGDLYISFKNKNGNWTASKSLGNEINSDKMDYCPYVDIKNNTLYFTSKRNSVKTHFSQPKTFNELMSEFNQYENGLSRLYTVSINKFLLSHTH